MTDPIAKRLRQAREHTGLSQRQLGIKAGFDEFSASPRINQYERGKHTPNYSTASLLARVLNVPTPFLYTKDDDLAELIILIGQLPVRQRRKLLSDLEKKTLKQATMDG